MRDAAKYRASDEVITECTQSRWVRRQNFRAHGRRPSTGAQMIMIHEALLHDKESKENHLPDANHETPHHEKEDTLRTTLRAAQTCRASPAARPARPASRRPLFCLDLFVLFCESRLQPRTPTNPKWFLHRSTYLLTCWTFVSHAYESQVVPASLDLLITGLAALPSFSGMLLQLLHHGAFGETKIA